MKELSIILTCEHAGNQVPVRYRSVFENEPALDSHRGWDLGALDITVGLSEALDIPCFVHHTTRLLVDINSSIGSNQLFSEFSQPLGDEDKQLLLDKYYFPYRLRVENAIAMTSKPVLHLSVHTFAPVSENVEHTADIGILVNLEREFERGISEKLSSVLKDSLPSYSVRQHVTSNGTADRFTTYLRTRFSDEEYAGIEIEVNQKFANTTEIEKIVLAIRRALLSLSGIVDVAQ
jgi:predicted N-formylglutamate amidohydrolase